MRPTDKQLARLPKWAQTYIDGLERKNESLHKQLTATWQEEQPESGMCVKRTDFNESPYRNRYLPLQVGDDLLINNVEVTQDMGTKDCMVRTTDGTLIVVLPDCANVVRVRGEER